MSLSLRSNINLSLTRKQNRGNKFDFTTNDSKIQKNNKEHRHQCMISSRPTVQDVDLLGLEWFRSVSSILPNSKVAFTVTLPIEASQTMLACILGQLHSSVQR